MITRSHFLKTTAAFALASTWPLRAEDPASPAGATPIGPNSPQPDRGPPLALTLVKEFVSVGHSNLPRVKELLADHPTLLNACWDWGSGDFETALGGAAHMGRRDIAEYLIASGTRMDVFAAAMLGHLDLVKAACAAFPNTPKVLGPHKIPLIVHAKKGGPAAAAVVEYLNSLGT